VSCDQSSKFASFEGFVGNVSGNGLSVQQKLVFGVNLPLPCPLFRQEINLSNACREPHADYNTRQNLELRAVIEDQWKKQLLEDMENEVKTNIEQLDKERGQELERTRNKSQEKLENK
jgi:hypothetical protein